MENTEEEHVWIPDGKEEDSWRDMKATTDICALCKSQRHLIEIVKGGVVTDSFYEWVRSGQVYLSDPGCWGASTPQ